MAAGAFERIGEETVRKAEQVDVPFESFVEGLESIIEVLRERLVLARHELDSAG